MRKFEYLFSTVVMPVESVSGRKPHSRQKFRIVSCMGVWVLPPSYLMQRTRDGSRYANSRVLTGVHLPNAVLLCP